MFVPYIDNVINFCGFGFIESMLEPHAREAAAMSADEIGYVFIIIGAVYFFSMLIAGYVSDSSITCQLLKSARRQVFLSSSCTQCSDHLAHPVILSIVGNVMMAVALLLVGPAPFLPMLATNKNLLYVCGAIIGFGYAQVRRNSIFIY
jgi:predicted MFS family arabinose efflux permease